MSITLGRFVRISLLAWLAFLAVDFVFHGGLLARWYENGSPALLPVEQAFARIPLGYAAFFLLVALIVWLGTRLGVEGAREGLALGFSIGVPLSAAHALGLSSITTIDPLLLVWWGVAEALELGVAGAVAGAALATARLGRLALVVAGGVVISLLVTVLLQSLS